MFLAPIVQKSLGPGLQNFQELMEISSAEQKQMSGKKVAEILAFLDSNQGFCFRRQQRNPDSSKPAMAAPIVAAPVTPSRANSSDRLTASASAPTPVAVASEYSSVSPSAIALSPAPVSPGIRSASRQSPYLNFSVPSTPRSVPIPAVSIASPAVVAAASSFSSASSESPNQAAVNPLGLTLAAELKKVFESNLFTHEQLPKDGSSWNMHVFHFSKLSRPKVLTDLFQKYKELGPS
jgi:hypothetical protein